VFKKKKFYALFDNDFDSDLGLAPEDVDLGLVPEDIDQMWKDQYETDNPEKRTEKARASNKHRLTKAVEEQMALDRASKLHDQVTKQDEVRKQGEDLKRQLDQEETEESSGPEAKRSKGDTTDYVHDL